MTTSAGGVGRAVYVQARVQAGLAPIPQFFIPAPVLLDGLVDGTSSLAETAVSAARAAGQKRDLAGGPGFEPRFSESESDVLPLNYPPTLSSPAVEKYASGGERRPG